MDVGKVILEEQNRTKDLLVQLLQPTGVVSALPVDATDFQSWLEATVGCIKEQYEHLQQSHTTTTTTTSSSSTSSGSSGVNNASVVTNSHPEQSSGTANSNNSDSSSRLNSSSNIIANNNLNTNSSVNSSLHEHANDGAVVNKNGATGGSDSGAEDDQQTMALRYEQMQKTVDQYKTIIADTVRTYM